MSENELDVRGLRKPEKHPTIFATYDAIAVGAAFVLVNNHDPKHLHEEFDVEHPGSYDWQYVDTGPQDWRIRIQKLAAAPLPRVVFDTAAGGDGRLEGAGWELPIRDRDLDVTVTNLVAGGSIDEGGGGDVDTLVHVLHGGGELTTERGDVTLRPGALVWLPRRSARQFIAGPDGLSYLTVHQRRRGLLLESA